MARIKTCTPHPLPIKNLDWAVLVPWIDKAREALTRFDAHLKWEDVSETKKGFEFAIQWAKTKKPFNTDFFCRIHAIVKKGGPNPEEIGHIRKRQNWIGPPGCTIEKAYFYPPEASLIKKHLSALYRYNRIKEKDPLVQLAIFFAQFLIIHPFMDGNGRVIRIYVPVWLWKKGLTSKPSLFLSTYFKKHCFQYVQKLYCITKENVWEDWIVFFLKGIIEQSKILTNK